MQWALIKCDVALSAKYWKRWIMVQMNTTLTCLSKFVTNIIYFNNTPEGTARLAQSVRDYRGWMTWGSRDPYFPCNIQTSSSTTPRAIQWVPGLSPKGWGGYGIKLTTKFHLPDTKSNKMYIATVWHTQVQLCDSRLLPWCPWGLCTSGMLQSMDG
jgi:hypothetical protein